MSSELHDARNLLIRLKSIYKITLSEKIDLTQDFEETLNKIKSVIEAQYKDKE